MVFRQRRDFLKQAAKGAAGVGLAVAGSTVSKVALAALPEVVTSQNPNTQPPPLPPNGLPFHPVVTLNGWSLPWRMNNNWKEFHLVAEPVIREMASGMKAYLWGYNGQSPGPTIEVVEGDQVRIFVTNRLPEHTTIHWHGQILPNGMDGVGGLTQPQIKPGQTYVYEFVAKRSGCFMYHPHADEMVQMAMGMMGLWITHPRDPNFMKVDRDFCFLLGSFDIDPGSYKPKISTMLDFNLWTFNSRVFPGIDSLPCRQGDKVRIRVGNLTMTNHPVHLHGYSFTVVGTDGGWINPSARWPEVTTDVGVGQMRAIEFEATELGDWALHCHKSHHTMNAMSHTLPNMIGVDTKSVTKKIKSLIPDYMAMGESGMAMISEMNMPLPENTLPMMMGKGQFGPIEMGGMFTVVKVRKNQPPGDYKDPGWYAFPKGSVAYQWDKPLSEPHREKPTAKKENEITFKVRKPKEYC